MAKIKEIWSEMHRRRIISYGSFLIIFIAIIYALLSDNDIIRQVIAGSLITAIIVLFLYGSWAFFYFKISYYNKMLKNEYNSTDKHVALIFPFYTNLFKNLSYNTLNTKKFFQRLKKEKIPFKVYITRESKDFQDIINNQKVVALLIFGHGTRHGVSINNDIFYYCGVKYSPNIKYIIQFHCNNNGGKALHEYFKCSGEVSDDYRVHSEINDQLKDKKLFDKLRNLTLRKN